MKVVGFLMFLPSTVDEIRRSDRVNIISVLIRYLGVEKEIFKTIFHVLCFDLSHNFNATSELSHAILEEDI